MVKFTAQGRVQVVPCHHFNLARLPAMVGIGIFVSRFFFPSHNTKVVSAIAYINRAYLVINSLDTISFCWVTHQHLQRGRLNNLKQYHYKWVEGKSLCKNSWFNERNMLLYFRNFSTFSHFNGKLIFWEHLLCFYQ